jgi:hypothetical protein
MTDDNFILILWRQYYTVSLIIVEKGDFSMTHMPQPSEGARRMRNARNADLAEPSVHDLALLTWVSLFLGGGGGYPPPWDRCTRSVDLTPLAVDHET